MVDADAVDDLAHPAAKQGPGGFVVRGFLGAAELAELFEDALRDVLAQLMKTLSGAHGMRGVKHHPLNERQGEDEQVVEGRAVARLGLPHQVAKAVGLHATYY